jgi:hypothetical protein
LKFEFRLLYIKCDIPVVLLFVTPIWELVFGHFDIQHQINIWFGHVLSVLIVIFFHHGWEINYTGVYFCNLYDVKYSVVFVCPNNNTSHCKCMTRNTSHLKSCKCFVCLNSTWHFTLKAHYPDTQHEKSSSTWDTVSCLCVQTITLDTSRLKPCKCFACLNNTCHFTLKAHDPETKH